MSKGPYPPAPPEKTEPTGWENYELWKRVCEAVRSLPDHFRSATNIEGMMAPDIFTLNSALGATIEEQVVETLNNLRSVWDPSRAYETYDFARQPQIFPDVILRKTTYGQDVLMGIEMKGWYLLAEEKMPNFRFTVTPACCNPWDLLVVVPWALSNVLAGSPIAYRPFLDSALYCAEQRNHYWRYQRRAKSEAGIILATGVGPYPKKSDKTSDRAVSDPSKNFGRLARYGIMHEYVAEMKMTTLRGVPVNAWLDFFHRHESAAEPDAIDNSETH